jgi:translation initiation factor IF-3
LSKFNSKNQISINEYIRAKELRVLGPDGENYGVIKTSEALSKAKELELDLIEVSPQANPPVAKIMDYGKYLYEQSKKLKAQKAKAHNVEVKSVQVKVATSENDLNIKAKRASSWLAEGHRIKLELFLPGRTKYLNEDFLKDRLGRILKLLTVDYKVAEEAKKSPKGLTMIIEKSK